MRPVHEPVGDGVGQRPWLAQQLRQGFVPAVDHHGDAVQGGEEGLPVVEDPDLVRRPVPAGLHVAESSDRREEVVEAAGEVAVRGAERRRVDVLEEQALVGLDQEAAVTGGVPGQLHDRHGTPPEVEHRAVVDGAHPLVTAQPRVSGSCRREDVRLRNRHAEPGEERVRVADGGDLRRVGDDRYLREHVEPRDVVLVRMGEGDEPDVRVQSTAPADLDGRVDPAGALPPADQQRVWRLESARPRGEERNAPVVGIGPARAVLPPAAHTANPCPRRTAGPATPAATPPSAPPR